MDPTTIVLALGHIKELAKLFGGDDKAKKALELLEKEIHSLQREADAKDKRIREFEADLGEVTKERDQLKEELAAKFLATDEVIEKNMLFRVSKSDGRRDGPFCANHKSNRLTFISGVV